MAPKDSVDLAYGLEESQAQIIVENWLEEQSQLVPGPPNIDTSRELIAPVSNVRRHDKKKPTMDKSPAALAGYINLLNRSQPQRFQRQRERRQAQLDAEGVQKPAPVDVAQDSGRQQAHHEADGENANQESQNLEDCIRNAQRALAVMAADESQQCLPAFNRDAQNDGEDGDAIHREDQGEELDDIDRELLNICQTRNEESPHNPMYSRPDLYDFQATVEEADDEDFEDFEQSPPKKKQRSGRKKNRVESRDVAIQEPHSRRLAKQNNKAVSSPRRAAKLKRAGKQQKKRVPRIVPSDSLLIFTEKQPMAEEDSENDALDLADDPVSQISLGFPPPRPVRQRQPGRSKAIIAFESKKKEGFGFGIDISEYRMPRSPNRFSQSQRWNPQTLSYSDGFEGLELHPTGRTMPVHRSHYCQDRIPKVTLSFGQLTLVGDRQTDDSDVENHGLQMHPKTPCEEPQAQVHKDEPMMIYMGPDQGILAKSAAYAMKNTTTQVTTSPYSTLVAPNIISSPLKRKSQMERRVTFEPIVRVHPQSKESSALIEYPLPDKKSQEMTASQQINQVTAKKSPKHIKKKGIPVDEQLSMVSIPNNSKIYYEEYSESNEEPSEDESQSSEESVIAKQDMNPDKDMLVTTTKVGMNNKWELQDGAYLDEENSDEETDNSESEDEQLANQEPDSVLEEWERAGDEGQVKAKVDIDMAIPETYHRQANLGLDRTLPDSDHRSSNHHIEPEPKNDRHCNVDYHDGASPDLDLPPISPYESQPSQTHSRSSNRNSQYLQTPVRNPSPGRPTSPRIHFILKKIPKSSSSEEGKTPPKKPAEVHSAQGSRTEVNITRMIIYADRDPQESLKPQEFQSSAISMEVEEDIFDSSSAKKRKRALSSRASSTLRSQPITRSQSLVMTSSRRMSPDEEVPTPTAQNYSGGVSKGSKIPGESQFLLGRSSSPCVQGTQVEKAPARNHSELKPSQQSYEPPRSVVRQASYFERASQQLQQPDLPVQRSKLSRAKSMFNRPCYDQGSQSTEIVSASIIPEKTFRNTVSSCPRRPPSSRRSSMYQEAWGGEKSLSELTRLRNAKMGTSSARRIMSSIPRLHSNLKPAQ